jgi:hypothetical protein
MKLRPVKVTSISLEVAPCGTFRDGSHGRPRKSNLSEVSSSEKKDYIPYKVREIMLRNSERERDCELMLFGCHFLCCCHDVSILHVKGGLGEEQVVGGELQAVQDAFYLDLFPPRSPSECREIVKYFVSEGSS